ncbi:hypothetical protein QF047_002268 [Arthrobacter sp. W4I7]|nr:hypothetical protein [Arthrobacter sp. W4I7]
MATAGTLIARRAGELADDGDGARRFRRQWEDPVVGKQDGRLFGYPAGELVVGLGVQGRGVMIGDGPQSEFDHPRGRPVKNGLVESAAADRVDQVGRSGPGARHVQVETGLDGRDDVRGRRTPIRHDCALIPPLLTEDLR